MCYKPTPQFFVDFVCLFGLVLVGFLFCLFCFLLLYIAIVGNKGGRHRKVNPALWTWWLEYPLYNFESLKTNGTQKSSFQYWRAFCVSSFLFG